MVWGQWRNRIRCGTCRALMDCRAPLPYLWLRLSQFSANRVRRQRQGDNCAPRFCGALDWSPYVMLQLMEREWLRRLPKDGKLSALPPSNAPSSRVLLVLVSHTKEYFVQTVKPRANEVVASQKILSDGTWEFTGRCFVRPTH
jgi:hypothetical protein